MPPDAAGASVRPYEPVDRSAVRRIAIETAAKGEPDDRLFPDRELLADLVTKYYTDFDSASSFVAKDGDRVVGYLTGCTDPVRFHRLMKWRILPSATLSVLFRGVFLRARTWRFARLNVPIWLGMDAFTGHELEYPAHLHINLEARFRGQGLGRQLVERFFDLARLAGVPGVHVSVREDNLPSRQFFERLGFVAILRRPFLRLDQSGENLLYSVVYGRKMP